MLSNALLLCVLILLLAQSNRTGYFAVCARNGCSCVRIAVTVLIPGSSIEENVWQGSMYLFTYIFHRCRIADCFSSHRRAQKAADANDPKHVKTQDDGGASDDEEDPESEEGVEDGMELGRDTRRPVDPYRSGVRHHHSTQQQHYQQPQYQNHQRAHHHVKPRSSYPSSSLGRTNGHPNGHRSHHRELAPAQSHSRPSSPSSGRGMHGVEMNEEDMDAEGEVYLERGAVARRPYPTGLADLDSPRGRLVGFLFFLSNFP
jgi:hypothetical protein